MSGYYTDKLSAERLKQCYEIAPPRVQQYLDAELSYVLQKTRPGDMVLDLGCGYGRIIPCLAQKAGQVIGIDTSLDNLLLGQQTLQAISSCHLLNMDAVHLAFSDKVFDLVVCIQNGISAFHVDQQALIRESVRVTKLGGKVLFSSYSDKFWEPRIEWFQLQAEAGLLGEIDYEKTCNGVIVCKDGFKATTVTPKQFLSITRELGLKTKIIEVDESSIFCEIDPH
ncbi:MAG: class I SAM-dependent methyltransferase [Promethearchaeota archaeon]